MNGAVGDTSYVGGGGLVEYGTNGDTCGEGG